MGIDTKDILTGRYKSLFYARLNTNHLNPERIHHSVQGRPVPHPCALTIEKIEPDDDEVLIRHLDNEGNELTHSHSYSLDDAFKDAHYEFGIQRHEWTILAPGDENSN